MSMLSLKALRDALAHKGQFSALIALVALGVMSFVTFQNSYYDLRRSLDTAYTRLGFAEITARVERAPMSVAHELEKLPGVTAARVRTVEDVGLERGRDARAQARIVSLPAENDTRVNKVVVLSGRFPAADDEILLHAKFAKDTGTQLGSTLTLRIGGERHVVRVVGIGTDPEYLYPLRAEGDLPAAGDFAIVYVNEAFVEKFFGRHGWGNDVAISTTQGANLEFLGERVEEELKPYGVEWVNPQTEQPGWAGLQSELDQNRVMSRTLPPLVLVISAMSLFIALSRLVQAQRGEIGLAKALGYGDMQLLGHYLTFGLIVAVAGSVLGIAVGLLGARAMAGSYVALLGLPFLESGIYPNVVVIAAGLSLATCAAAAIIPAIHSARLLPAIAMHSDPNKSLAGGHVPIVERLLSPVLPRSFTFRIPLRNVFRARRRSLYTVLGISLAMILGVVTVAMFDSMDYLLQKAFTQVERWDIVAAFDTPVGPARVAEIAHLPGVTRVQPALTLPVTITAHKKDISVSLTAMQPSADFHGFSAAGGKTPQEALAAGDMVLATSMAKRLGVQPGDVVSVDSPLVNEPVPLRVGALTNEILGQPGFVSLATATQLTGKLSDSYNSLYLYADSRREETIQDEIYDMPGVANVQVKSDLVERLKALLKLFNVFGSVLLVFGSGLAFVVVYTTFTANVTERTREIATMRTIGEDNGRLSLMVTLENLLLAVAALPLGVWLGMRTANLIFSAFESESYTLTAFIYPASVVRICLLMVGVLLLSELPPVRRIFALDLAEATKVME